jgi:hypothetical protein
MVIAVNLGLNLEIPNGLCILYQFRGYCLEIHVSVLPTATHVLYAKILKGHKRRTQLQRQHLFYQFPVVFIFELDPVDSKSTLI